MYMKMKMTRNQISDLPVVKIVAAGYCGLQYLLSGVDPVAYNAGINGWNYDVYIIENIAILTGYRIPHRYPNASKVEEYERRAADIRDSSVLTDDILSELNELRKEFVAEQLRN